MNVRETFEFWDKRRRIAMNAGMISFFPVAIASFTLAGLGMLYLAAAIGVAWFCIGASASAYVGWKHYKSFVSYRIAWGKSEADAKNDYQLLFPQQFGA